MQLFEMDKVELIFTEEALQLAAEMALERETGARGLRSILENSLLEVMYEIPSRPEVRGVVVDKLVIAGSQGPKLLNEDGQEIKQGEDLDLRDAA
jgi:ATP-dependent Clp protease ATP-binding subunit ClpX